MDNSKQQNQSRFIIAALLCMAVLFGWQYFLAPKPKPAPAAPGSFDKEEFRNDPLIKAALEAFRGQIVDVRSS